MGEIGRGADEKHGVAVYEAGDGRNVNLIGGRGAGYQMDFDAEVFASFAEGCVTCFGEDPRG